MDKHSKVIIYSIATILGLIAMAFCIFIIANWNYISNPRLIPNYTEGIGIFGYGKDDLAKYRIWAFELPMAIIPYLIFIETFLLTYLLFKNTLRVTRPIIFLLLGMFLISVIVDILPHPSSPDLYYQVSSSLDVLVYFVAFILLLTSIVLLFIKKFKHSRLFLALNIITVIMLYIFLMAYMRFFFD